MYDEIPRLGQGGFCSSCYIKYVLHVYFQIREKVLLLPGEIPNGNFISLNDIIAPKPTKSIKKTDVSLF